MTEGNEGTEATKEVAEIVLATTIERSSVAKINRAPLLIGGFGSMEPSDDEPVKPGLKGVLPKDYSRPGEPVPLAGR